MAEVNTDSGGGHGGKHDKKRAKKQSTRIDMTPMVDLAFLLLTFFVMTSTFSKPKAMEINYPADPDPNEKPVKIKNAMTFILSGDDKIFYYDGEFNKEGNAEGKPATDFLTTDFSANGLRKILFERNKDVRDSIAILEESYKRKEIADTTLKKKVSGLKGKRESLTVLVKADEKATYKNVIDVIDELNISMIGKYAVVDLTPDELELLLIKTGNAPAASATTEEKTK